MSRAEGAGEDLEWDQRPTACSLHHVPRLNEARARSGSKAGRGQPGSAAQRLDHESHGSRADGTSTIEDLYSGPIRAIRRRSVRGTPHGPQIRGWKADASVLTFRVIGGEAEYPRKTPSASSQRSSAVKAKHGRLTVAAGANHADIGGRPSA